MKLSIIVPVYNCFSLLKRCVDSILAQTMRDFELILVDDGSTDGSENIVDEYATHDTRVRAIHQPNQGVSAARNTGIRAATGDYIGFVDSDDWIEPRMYELCLAAAQKYDADIVKCGVVSTDGVKTYSDYAFTQGERFFDDNLPLVYFKYRGSRAVWNGIFRSGIARAVEYPVGITAGEDDYVSFAYLMVAKSIVFIPDVCYNYYQYTAVADNDANAEILHERVRRYSNSDVMRERAARKMVELVEGWDGGAPQDVYRLVLQHWGRKCYHLVRAGASLDLTDADKAKIFSVLDFRRCLMWRYFAWRNARG